eukprot:1196063-Prorocentrum_minimum.AAC.4
MLRWRPSPPAADRAPPLRTAPAPPIAALRGTNEGKSRRPGTVSKSAVSSTEQANGTVTGLRRLIFTLTSFYGTSCANNGKGALNTPGFETVLLFRTRGSRVDVTGLMLRTEGRVEEAGGVAGAADVDGLEGARVLQLLQDHPAVEAGCRLPPVGLDAPDVVGGGGVQEGCQRVHLRGRQPGGDGSGCVVIHISVVVRGITIVHISVIVHIFIFVHISVRVFHISIIIHISGIVHVIPVVRISIVIPIVIIVHIGVIIVHISMRWSHTRW